MLVDPKIHSVAVKRRIPDPVQTQQERACRRYDGSQMEATAWNQVLQGKMSVAEYHRICDKVAIFNRKA